jgi:hypothetical protein
VQRQADPNRCRPARAEGCRMKYIALTVIFLGGTMLLQWMPVMKVQI